MASEDELDDELVFEYSDPIEETDAESLRKLNNQGSAIHDPTSPGMESTPLHQARQERVRRPIETERTISLSSTSAPHGKLRSYAQASLLGQMQHKLPAHDSSQHTPPHGESSEEEEEDEHTMLSSDEDAPLSPQVLSVRKKHRRSSVSSQDSQRSSPPSPSPEEKRNVRRYLKKNQPNILRFDESVEEQTKVGSLPSGRFLKEVQRRRHDHDIQAPKRKVDSGAGKDKKYITVPTLSFTHDLSPGTPSMTLGASDAPVRLVITVGVHGDEPCGMHGFNELLEEGYFDHLPAHISLTALVGNPGAVDRNQRFLEHNLNRMMRKDLFHKKSYEAERARVVAAAIKRCTVYMDLHSCSAHAPAHALPMNTNESVRLASQLPVGFVIRNLAHTTKGNATTLDYALSLGKTAAVCVECGQHTERQTIDNAKACIRTLLEIYQDRPPVLAEPPVILMCSENEPVRQQFQFTRPVQAFEKVPEGEEIARDITGPIYSKYEGGTYIVMPTHNPVLGEEAFFYAQESFVPTD